MLLSNLTINNESALDIIIESEKDKYHNQTIDEINKCEHIRNYRALDCMYFYPQKYKISIRIYSNYIYYKVHSIGKFELIINVVELLNNRLSIKVFNSEILTDEIYRWIEISTMTGESEDNYVKYVEDVDKRCKVKIEMLFGALDIHIVANVSD